MKTPSEQSTPEIAPEKVEQISKALAQAMWLLETWLLAPSSGNGLPVQLDEIGWSAHDLVRSALLRLTGDDECQISPHTERVVSVIQEVPQEIMEKWREREELQCSATTKSGNRCRLQVHGSHGHMTLSEYVKHYNGHCYAHSEN